jgi:hypothetical protein
VNVSRLHGSWLPGASLQSMPHPADRNIHSRQSASRISWRSSSYCGLGVISWVRRRTAQDNQPETGIGNNTFFIVWFPFFILSFPVFKIKNAIVAASPDTI